MLELIKYEIVEDNQVLQKETTIGVTFSTYEEMEQFKHNVEEKAHHKVWLTYQDTTIKTEQDE